MTRGNQRDIDRERAKKRSEKNQKSTTQEFSKRKLTDADIMREKQKKAEEKKQKEEEEIIKASLKQKDQDYLKKFEQLNVQDNEDEDSQQ